MRQNPFDLEELFDRLSTQFEEGMGGGPGLRVPGSVPVDVVDHGDEYVVTVDLPGYDTDEVDLTLVDDALNLEAARTNDDPEPGRYITRERTDSAVNRRIRIPEPVEEDGVTASYEDGVLSVTLPKVSGGDDSHQIDID